MPRRVPLPPELGHRFSVAEARRRGVTHSRLRSAELVRPFPGVRLRGGHGEIASLLGQCENYLPRLREFQFFSHETALMLLGVPLPEYPYRPRIHVAAHRPQREPRIAEVVGHRLQRREPAIMIAQGRIPVEHPVRAWRQCASLWPLDALIAAADHLIGTGGYAEIDELREEVRIMGDSRHRILHRAISEARVGAESARETALRLAIVRAGLPEPLLNWVLRDARGREIARLDQAYPRWRVSVEYDGRVHAEDARQFERDADRWDRIRDQGWTLVRILAHHMRGVRPVAPTKVRNALLDAGWRPGLPG